MEVKYKELTKHAKRINAVLSESCNASNTGPLVQETDGTITITPSCPRPLCKEVTTDLGSRELALLLPTRNNARTRFWIALHERWDFITKYKIRFLDCGLRLYVANENEEAIQFLRLEWVAPVCDADGVQNYQGKHAGHPHWHIDRSVLLGSEEYLRSFDALAAPLSAPAEIEDFSEATAVNGASRSSVDYSWLQKLHLPAQAQWMGAEWDGQKIPGPHQSEPGSLDELACWWTGALRYLSAELPR
jgi:hypothetical protein